MVILIWATEEMKSLLVNNSDILVVDDNNGIRQLMCEFFSLEGFFVKQAADGLTALQLVMEEKPKLVLLDMRMPGLGGIQTLAKLRDIAPEIIVVIMCAYFDAKYIEEAIEKGQIKHYIFKPFDLEEVGIIISNLLNNNYSTQSLNSSSYA